MNRQDIKALLHGVENAGEIVDRIMEINGADIENAKKAAGGGMLSRENEQLKAENERLAGELKAYEKGGAKYVDAAELERLKKFETDTLAAQKRQKQENAVRELLKKNHARDDMLELLLKGVAADGVELAEDGTVKDGDKIVKDLKEKYAAGFSEAEHGTGGAPFQKPNPAGGTGGDGGFNFGFTPIRKVSEK